jgi:uncharacterized membrane protein
MLAKKARTTLFLGLILCLVLVVVPFAVGANSQQSESPALAKIDSFLLEEIQAEGEADFFIWLTEQADVSGASQLQTKLEKGQYVFDTLQETADLSQRALRAYLDDQGVGYRPFYVANMVFVANGSENLLLDIAARPDVDRILPNRQFQLQEPFDQRDAPAGMAAVEPNVTFIRATDVWAMGITGQGTVMAGGDTGMQWNHPALINHYRGWDGANADHNYNWWDATNTYPLVPTDGHGHGTHISGTMVGDDGGANQIGVAPGAQVIHCKNMTDGGSGNDFTFTTCFEWVLAPWDLSGQNPMPSLAPDAMNNSWGYWGGGQPQFTTIIENLHAAGILVQVAAGNEGPSCSTLRSPGDYEMVLSTGSVNHAGGVLPGTLTGFSSRGPSSLFPNAYIPTIMAPGQNIRSSLPGGVYQAWSGTSMASPHATALVGLMWSANPGLAGMVEETMDIIRDTAVPLTGVGGSNCGGDYDTGPNNDWGFGTIDALAAVEAAILFGGVGNLDGTVTDQDTSAPIAGATVQAMLDPDTGWSAVTDANGYYNRVVLSGTYTVTASAFGYLPSTVTDIEVTEGMTTTVDFSLETAENYLVSGQVTDVNTGWPLYASIQIIGSPYTIWTDPVDGSYSVSLPAGIEYTFNVNAWVAGYLAESRDVGPLTGDATEDFALDVDVAACTAPGYSPTFSFFDDFESGYGEWTMSGLWNAQSQSDTCGSMVAPFPSPVNAAYYGDEVACNFDVGANTGSLTMINPVTIPGGASLSYWSFEETECGGNCTWDKRFTEVSIDGGTTWTTIGEGHTEGVWHQRTFDLTPYAGEDLHVRFRFDSIDGVANAFFGWMVDDVAIATGCEPSAGSIVVGNVYDENTGNALNGAMVSGDSGETAMAKATPDDPNVDDGFYTIFAPEGSNVLTATHTSAYGSDSAAIVVGDGDTVHQDFWLPAGWLEVDPTSLSVNLLMGASMTTTLELSNLGNLDADFQLTELDGGFNPTMANSGTIDWLYRDTGGIAVEGADSGQTVAYPGAYQYIPNQAYPADVSILIYTDDWWHTTPNTYPEQAIAYLGLPATIFVDGNYAGFESALSTGGPWDLVIWSGENYVIPASTLTALLNYVNDGGALAATYWQQVAIPTNPLWAAMGFEYLANDLAAPPAYWWEDDHAIFNHPLEAPEWIERFARSGTSQGTYVGPLDDSLVVAGYTTSPQPGQGNIVIREDGLTVYKGIRDLSSDADSNGSGMPDAAELWVNIITGLIDGFGSDVPWLSTDPTEGTVGALDNEIVEVTFDASVPEVNQPGEYLATLRINNNTPYGAINVPVSMTVEPSPTVGKLEGVVSSLGYCDNDPAALADVEVLVESYLGNEWTLTTDANGYYQLWVDESHSPLTVSVAPPAHEPGMETDIIITGQMTTTVDFDLRWLVPCVTAAPDTLEVTVESGDSETVPFTIYNAGAGDASFQIRERDGGYAPSGSAAVAYEPAPSIPAELFTGVAPAGHVPPAAVENPNPLGPWQTLASAPFVSMDNVYLGYDGKGYLIGGYGANGQVGIYDPDANSWTTGATEPAPHIQYPVDGCFGFDSNGDPVAVLFNDTTSGATTLHRYNMETNSWDTPPVPSGFPANGLWATSMTSLWNVTGENVCYISGGATTPGGGNTSALYAYYPDSNTVENLGNFNYLSGGFAFHASWYVPWIGSDGGICVGGGVNAASVVTANTQCYDIGAATFNAANADLGPMPAGLWGMATGILYEDGDYQLWVANGADTAFELWPNAAYFSESSGQWHMGPTPPRSIYRVSGTNFAAEDGYSFYVATGSTGGFTPSSGHERNYSADFPPLPGTDVPWLSQDPTEGTVPADDSFEVQITFTAFPTMPLGTYTATMTLLTNDPVNNRIDVPVTMVVTGDAVYNPVIAPVTAADSGDPGEVVVYDLTVANMGNTADTINLSLSGNVWDSELSDDTLMLGPGETADITVEVTVPADAMGGEMDMVTVTAVSDNDPGAMSTAELTTTANAVHGMEMMAHDTALSGLPGETVHYMLTLTNTGNVVDTFTLSDSGHDWDTTYPADVTLDPGEGIDVVVSVTIPANAEDGDSDTVQVTVTSTGDPAVWMAVSLTTSAEINYGLLLSPATAESWGAPGDTVEYTLTITNSGNVADTFTLMASDNNWDVDLPDDIELAAGASATFIVSVTIPTGAADGAMDTVTVTATSQGDPAESASSELTTTALIEEYILYLPIIMRP